MPTFAETLAGSAALAATGGQRWNTATVHQALSLGARLARHGGRVPLYALLDLCALHSSERSFVLLPDPERGAGAATFDYDRWVHEFSHTAARLLRGREPATPEAVAWLLEWPGSLPKDAPAAPVWETLYNEMMQHEQRILADWSKKGRTVSKADWQQWWASGQPPEQRPIAAGFWARFDSTGERQGTHERMEHHAAHLALTAEELPFRPGQVVKVQQFRHQRAEEGRSITESIEEQTLDAGVIALSTLALDEDTIDYLLAQGSYTRLGSPPLSFPPLVRHLHLGFAVSYRSQSRKVCVPELRQRLGSKEVSGIEELTAAALLQALVALLLEDWRSALIGLRVRLHLHRHSPRIAGGAADIDAGGPGPRWQDRVWGSEGLMPPANVVGLLFERLDSVSLASAPLAWHPAEPRRGAEGGWWCGCLLRDDLETLGFSGPSIASRSAAESGHWTGPLTAFPHNLRHLIVVDASTLSGLACRVVRDPDACRLRPVQQRPGPTEGILFGELRLEALDVMLDTLLDPSL